MNSKVSATAASTWPRASQSEAPLQISVEGDEPKTTTVPGSASMTPGRSIRSLRSPESGEAERIINGPRSRQAQGGQSVRGG